MSGEQTRGNALVSRSEGLYRECPVRVKVPSEAAKFYRRVIYVMRQVEGMLWDVKYALGSI